MDKHLKGLIVAFGIALASTGVAYADDGGGDNGMSRWTGDSYKTFEEARKVTLTVSGEPGAKPDKLAAACDNSMSRFCGESYAAFQQGLVGDFYTERDELARSSDDRARQFAAAPVRTWGVGHAFRDDTAG